MLINNVINKLKESYSNWFNSSILFGDLKDDYLSVDNSLESNIDSVSVYVKVKGPNTLRLSDFGYTIFHLSISGIKLNKSYKVRWNIFQNILKVFHIHYENSSKSLYVDTNVKNFPFVRINFLKAISHIEDISYLNKRNIRKSFKDIVVDYLKSNNFKFQPAPKKSDNNLPIHFNFSIPSYNKSHQCIYKLVKAVSKPNDVNQAKLFNYDVRIARYKRAYHFIFLVNDIKNYGSNNKLKQVNPIIKRIALGGLNKRFVSSYKYSELRNNNKILSNNYY